jgi:hypothetical protein
LSIRPTSTRPEPCPTSASPISEFWNGYRHVSRLVARTTDFIVVGVGYGGIRSRRGPGPKFKLFAEKPNDATISPDHQLKLEQYSRDLGDQGYVYQFWTFDSHHHHAFLLNRGEDRDFRRLSSRLSIHPGWPVAGT